jgi:hypothetical protein
VFRLSTARDKVKVAEILEREIQDIFRTFQEPESMEDIEEKIN